ncbi:MAG: hypothetical protein DA330_03670 [Nitrososphaera sp.]|nr:hypothetical protein [Nitrososphaera sp.]
MFGVLATALNTNAAYAQSDDKWYIGEGAKANTYVKYVIKEYDVNSGEPYEMTIYFKEQDANGVWTAPTFVEYKGRVFTGTLLLGNNLAVLGGSDVPDNMRPFVGGYSRSLQWLEAFTAVSKPLSLSQGSWGKIAAIGGEEVKPMGKETISVPAGSYETTILGWHKGVDNRIWVANDFPYPIKAETFVEISSGRAPTLFAFTLLKTGTGEPSPPSEFLDVPNPPLKKSTGRGTYVVDLDWTPESIEPGNKVVFGVGFTDNNGKALFKVNYDFTIIDSVTGKVIKEFKRLNTDVVEGAPVGYATVEHTFENGGPVTVSVLINSAAGQTTGEFIEKADFNIVVVPEFPVTAAIIAGVAISFVVVAARLRRTGLGSMFSGRSPI